MKQSETEVETALELAFDEHDELSGDLNYSYLGGNAGMAESAKSGSRLLRQWKAMHENAMVEAEQDDGPRPPEGVRAE